MSFLAGFVVIGFIGWAGLYFSKGISFWEGKMMQKTDRRVKMVNEIFNNIKVIKMNGWESLFKKRIDKVRKSELLYLKNHLMS